MNEPKKSTDAALTLRSILIALADIHKSVAFCRKHGATDAETLDYILNSIDRIRDRRYPAINGEALR